MLRPNERVGRRGEVTRRCGPTLASPTTPITAIRRPAAASTTSQRSTSGLPVQLSATAASARPQRREHPAGLRDGFGEYLGDDGEGDPADGRRPDGGEREQFATSHAASSTRLNRPLRTRAKIRSWKTTATRAISVRSRRLRARSQTTSRSGVEGGRARPFSARRFRAPGQVSPRAARRGGPERDERQYTPARRSWNRDRSPGRAKSASARETAIRRA